MKRKMKHFSKIMDLIWIYSNLRTKNKFLENKDINITEIMKKK